MSIRLYLILWIARISNVCEIRVHPAHYAQLLREMTTADTRMPLGDTSSGVWFRGILVIPDTLYTKPGLRTPQGWYRLSYVG